MAAKSKSATTSQKHANETMKDARKWWSANALEVFPRGTAISDGPGKRLHQLKVLLRCDYFFHFPLCHFPPPTHCWHNWWWKLRWWSAMAPQSPSQLNKCWQLWTKGAQRRRHSWCHTIPRFYYELRGFIWTAKFILPFQTLNILESICTRFFFIIIYCSYCSFICCSANWHISTHI